jgi:glycosyltransferase involved in cell wall biosynthesis
VNTPDAPEVSVVMPCLNEEATVGLCVERAARALSDAGITAEIVVCDNGSTDNSADEAQRAGARVVTESRRGYGSAYMAGINASRGRMLVLADADGTYPLEDAPAFVRRVRDGGGLVMGSRFRGRILPGSMPALHRLVGSPGTRFLIRVLFGVRCSDPHCGMRAMMRETYEKLAPASRGMEFAIEMVVNAPRADVPITEIPITYAARAGESKLRALPDGWKLLRFMLVHSPTFLFLAPGLAATAAGAGGLAWLASGDRTVGNVTFSLNSMLVCALLTVAGYQVVTLGMCARAYLLVQDGREPGRLFTLERGLVAGLAATLLGLVLVARVGAHWLSSDFGRLSLGEHRLALAGLTATIVGMQTLFSSFLLSLLRETT